MSTCCFVISSKASAVGRLLLSAAVLKRNSGFASKAVAASMVRRGIFILCCSPEGLMIQGELRFPEQFAAYLLFGQCRVLQGSGQYRLLIYPVLILPNASR